MSNQGKVYPRVGGGNLALSGAAAKCVGLSPRGRGKLTIDILGMSIVRSIPAWAGETRLLFPVGSIIMVYPRVGGGNAGYSAHSRLRLGLSPRGRGKPP